MTRSLSAGDTPDHLPSRVMSNAIFSVLGWLWPVALNLVTLPYIVSRLGDEAFGVLALIQATIGFLSFADLGLNTASIKYIAEYWGSNDREAINEVVGVTLAVYAFVGLIGLASIALLSRWLVVSVLGVSDGMVGISTTAFQLGALGFLANTVSGTFGAIPAGLQRFDVTSKMTGSLATASTVSSVVVLALGGSLPQVVLARAVVSLAGILVFYVAAKRLLPSLAIRRVWNRSLWRSLLSFGEASLVNRAAGTLIFQLDRLLVGSFLGAAAVTYYVVPATVVQQVHQLLSNATVVLFPLSSSLVSQNESDLLRKLYTRMTKYTTVAATAGYLPIVLLGPSLLRVWMGGGFSLRSGSTLTLLAISCYVLSYNVVPYHLLNGMGSPGVNAVSAAVGGVLDVGLCLLLVPRMGIVGAAVANLVSMVRIPFYLLYANARLLKVPSRSVLASSYKGPWIVAIPVLVAIPALKVSPRHAYTLLAAALTIVAFYLLMAALVGVLDARDREAFVQWVKFTPRYRAMRRAEPVGDGAAEPLDAEVRSRTS